MKRKDALTDLVEHAQGTPTPEPSSTSSNDRQVVNSAGETITLGQKPTKTTAMDNKSVSLELERLVEITRAALEKALENMSNRLKKRE